MGGVRLPNTRALLISVIGSQLRSEHEFILSDELILQVIISYCDHNVSAKLMTDRLFEEFGTLSAIIAAPPARLRQVEDMTDRLNAFIKFLHMFKVKSFMSGIPDRQNISNSSDLKQFLMAKLRHLIVEEFHVIYLDNNSNLLECDLVCRGTIDHTACYPMEIVKRAIQLGANSIILAHNHPSRRSRPSPEDLSSTARIIEVCRPLAITVHDHVIVAGNDYISLRELGRL